MDLLQELERLSPEILQGYLQIGRLELKLRKVIPFTLNNSKFSQPHQLWHQKIHLTPRSLEVLNRAVSKDSRYPEHFLPFSFWRYLLSGRNYAGLWVPNLYQCFPELSSPQTHKTFQTVDIAMNSALRLRNNLAHYQIHKLGNINYSLKRVNWLIDNVRD
jgi:hypothetical protein